MMEPGRGDIHHLITSPDKIWTMCDGSRAVNIAARSCVLGNVYSTVQGEMPTSAGEVFHFRSIWAILWN